MYYRKILKLFHLIDWCKNDYWKYLQYMVVFQFKSLSILQFTLTHDVLSIVKYWIGDVDFWRKENLVSPTIQSSFRSTKRFSSRCLFSIYYVCTMKFTIICWLEKPLSSCCRSVALYNLQTLQSFPHHFCYTLIFFSCIYWIPIL